MKQRSARKAEKVGEPQTIAAATTFFILFAASWFYLLEGHSDAYLYL
jgi:hypothetical protein